LQIAFFDGREGRSTADLDPKSRPFPSTRGIRLIIGRSCRLEISRGSERRRAFNGVVFKAELLGDEGGKDVARLSFAPAVLALSHGSNSRIFEKKTPIEIIEKVLKAGLQPFKREVKMPPANVCAEREYVVQYEEDDLRFVERLMSEEGLCYCFDQSGETETLVVVERNDRHDQIETMSQGSK